MTEQRTKKPKRKRPSDRVQAKAEDGSSSGKRSQMSPEARAKLSRLAKERVAEGKMGGAQFGKLGGAGNTREKRLAAQTVAEYARESADEIVAVFRDAIDSDRPLSIRMKGAESLLKIEGDAEKMALKEKKAAHEAMSREEMLRVLSEKLTNSPEGEVLQKFMPSDSDIEGTAVERVINDD